MQDLFQIFLLSREFKTHLFQHMLLKYNIFEIHMVMKDVKKKTDLTCSVVFGKMTKFC